MRPSCTSGRKPNPLALPTWEIHTALGSTLPVTGPSGVGLFGSLSLMMPTHTKGFHEPQPARPVASASPTTAVASGRAIIARPRAR